MGSTKNTGTREPTQRPQRNKERAKNAQNNIKTPVAKTQKKEYGQKVDTKKTVKKQGGNTRKFFFDFFAPVLLEVAHARAWTRMGDHARVTMHARVTTHARTSKRACTHSGEKIHIIQGVLSP